MNPTQKAICHLLDALVDQDYVAPRTGQNILAHLEGYNGLKGKLREEGFRPPYAYYCADWMKKYGESGATQTSDPTPHLPDLDEMEDIHAEIRYTARCGDCGLAMIVDYHPSSLNCPACGSDDLEFMRIGGEPGDDQRVFTGHADRRMLIENVKRLIQKGCPLKEYMDAERLAEAIVDGPVADRIEKEQKRHG